MKQLSVENIIKIPEGVTVNAKARVVTVKGPRGTLRREFKHVDLQLEMISAHKMKVLLWHAGRKHAACLRTVASGIMNMIKGVTKGFEYKMRFVYAHFPINVAINNGGKDIEIRNFLGEKIVRKVQMREGVTVATSDVKDEIVITGNDVVNVSHSAASIQQSTLVKNKDIRKFLDGIYLSERGLVVKDN